MASAVFGAAIDIVSDDKIRRPPPVRTSSNRPPSNEELDAIELPDYGLTNGQPLEKETTPTSVHSPSNARTSISHDTKTPKTPSELERSQPPTPKQERAARVVPSWSYPSMNKWRVLSACLQYFGNGVNDSAPGPLIPYIEPWYNIGFAVVSTIWIANAVGFILSAFCNDFVCARLGRSKTLMFSEALMITAYTVIVCPVPFAVVVVAYMVMGFGEAMNLAMNNVFCANLSNSTVILGAAHGSYGIGGIVAPLAATALVSHGVHWSRFYIITIGIRVLCLAFAGWSFHGYEKEETTKINTELERIASRQAMSDMGEPSKMQLLGRALKNRTTIIGALFIFAYQGAEVSDAGWFISYLIDYRNGNPAHVGYVTSGFWGGITVGRFVLTHVAKRVGERRFIFAMGIGVIVLQILAWVVPNVVGDSISVSLLGLLLGPVYPCAQTVFTRLLPNNIQVFAISFISSAGSSGGAIVPFLTGLIAQGAGTYVLHPVCIAFYVVMLGCWAGLPRPVKRVE